MVAICEYAALLANDRSVERVELATRWRAKLSGLIGCGVVDGALWLWPARSAHTVGMRFPLDVAYMDRAGTVVVVTSMKQQRFGRLGASWDSVLEAERGSFDRWELGGWRRGRNRA